MDIFSSPRMGYSIKSYPMDDRPGDAFSLAFQSGVIALLDVHKTTTFGFDRIHRGRNADF